MKKRTKTTLILVVIILAFVLFNVFTDYINWNGGKCRECNAPWKLVAVTNNDIRLYHYVCPKCGKTIEITWHIGG